MSDDERCTNTNLHIWDASLHRIIQARRLAGNLDI